MIVIRPGRYFSAVWSVPFEGGDYLATLWRDSGEPWHLSYRWRYDGPDGEDVYNWHDAPFGADTPEAEILKAGNGLADMVAKGQGNGSAVTKLVLRSDDPEPIAAMSRREPIFCFGDTTPAQLERS